jgi:hypothetical protein
MERQKMRNITRAVCFLGLLAAAAFGANPKTKPPSSGDGSSIVIVFKDGHRQSFSLADIANIEFKTPPGATASLASLGRSHFTGKWEVGDGNGDNFFITLEANGDARKSIGSAHGTWTIVDGDARISWDDGWRDIIRKVGTKHQKLAYGPGKSFSDEPSNIAGARNTQPKPL